MTAPSSPSPDLRVCPNIKEYTVEEQQAAAQEMASLPLNSTLAQFIADYLTLRDKLRATRD